MANDNSVRVVGIDDWAWRKGQHHLGTILVDVERRCVVDVLASRTADAVAAWLGAHPDTRIISRDRHGPYADGVRQAKQVADRFHLVLTLRGAVPQELARQRSFLAVPLSAVAPPVRPTREAPASPPRQRPSAVVAHERRIVQERQTLQLERFRLVKRLEASGRSAHAIMRETGLGRAYVRKWVHVNEPPTRNRMAPRPGMPDFYREYLHRRWTEGCQSGRLPMAEIQTLGYVGGYSGLAKLLAPWRKPAAATRDRWIDCDAAIHDDEVIDSAAPMPAVLVRHVSPQIWS